MKTYVSLISVLVLFSCGNSDQSNNESPGENEEIAVETTNLEEEENPMNTQNPVSKNKDLGKKYLNLVDADILTLDEAQTYSDIESKYRDIHIKLKQAGNWDGSSPENINHRKKWHDDKKSEIIANLGAEKYTQIQQFLKRNK